MTRDPPRAGPAPARFPAPRADPVPARRRSVEAQSIRADHAAAKAQGEEERKKAAGAARAAAAEAETLAAAKRSALERIGQFMKGDRAQGDPHMLYTLAAGTVSEFTSASCYVVAVEDPDELGAPAVAGEEGEEPAAEDPPAEEDGEGEEGGEDKPAFDYSKKVLEYVVAGPGQNLEEGFKLVRPPPPAEEDAEPSPSPLTFSVLDGAADTLDIPNVLYEDKVSYFSGFPRLGSYFVTTCKLETGEKKVLLCCDTLAPNKAGNALTAEEKAFIQEVAGGMSESLKKAEAGRGATLKAAPRAESNKEVAEEIARLAESTAAAVEAAESDQDKLDAAASQAKAVLGVVLPKITEVKDEAHQELLGQYFRPKSTAAALRAAAAFFGVEKAKYESWKSCRGLLLELHGKMEGHSSAAAVDAARVAAAKGLLTKCTAKTLPSETPATDIGFLVAKFVDAALTGAEAAAGLKELEAAAAAAAKEAEEAAKAEAEGGEEAPAE